MRLLKGLAALLVGAGTVVGIVAVATMTDSGPPGGEIRVLGNSANVDQGVMTAQDALPSDFGRVGFAVFPAIVVITDTGREAKEVSAFALTRAVIQYSGPMANYYLAEEVDLRRTVERPAAVARPLRC